MLYAVTGALGQVGTELTRRLSSLGLDYVAFSRADLDITSAEQTRALLSSARPDAVINCAAYNQVDKGEQEPALAFAINRDGPANLAAVCAEIGSVLVHYSTDYVFDGARCEPYSESSPTNPLSVYGRSKLAGEQAVLRSHAAHLVLRVSWVFGRIGESFVDDVLRWAAAGTLRVVDDQRSVPCDAVALATDTIAVTQQLTGKPEMSGLYHFAMKPAVTRHQYAQIIVEEAARLGIIEPMPVLAVSSNYFASPAERPSYSVLDSRKFVQQFGIEPGDWRAGLKSCLDTIRQGSSESA